MVFLVCPSAVFPTAVWNPAYPVCAIRANSTESLTGCGSDDTTGVETCPTGTALAFLPLAAGSVSSRFPYLRHPCPAYIWRPVRKIFQQCYLLLVGHLCGLLYRGSLLQLLHLGFQCLLFGVFSRCLIETAERGVNIVIGGCGRRYGPIPAVSTATIG